MPPETTYPTTRPNWLAETGSGAAPQGALAGPLTPSRGSHGRMGGPHPLNADLSTPVVVALGTLASPATLPTPANIVAIMSAVCAFYGIPCALGLTVLDHECPGSLATAFSTLTA